MSDNLPAPNPYEGHRKALVSFFNESQTYGYHTDEDGPNEGCGYVVEQVLEAMRVLNIPPEPAAFIFATMVCMEETLTGGFAYTSDMPMFYDNMVKAVKEGTNE